MPTPDFDDDDNKFARGAMNASLLSVPIWALVIALTCWSCGAFAQSANAGAESNSGAVAGAGASSGSTAIVIFPTNTGPTAQQAGEVARAQGYNGQAGFTRNQQDVNYSGRTQQDQTVTYGGQFRQDYRATIRNTPDAYAPAITGGTNPCQQGVSGGGSVAGFGLALGGSWSDPNCERRNLSALLHNQGQPQLAQEVLCETDTVRQARQRMGQPCIIDQPQRMNAQGPVQMMVPAAAPVLVPQQAVTTVRTIPDWCATATAAERRRYPAGTCG